MVFRGKIEFFFRFFSRDKELTICEGINMATYRNILPTNRKNLRSNPEQIKYLVDYMSTHNMFALGEFTGPLGRRAHNEEWERLQGALKALGPHKTVEQWKNTWRDLKKKARHDGARYNLAINKTGNKPEYVPPVPSTSRKIINIIGTESAYGIGLGQSSETGLGEFPADVIIIEDTQVTIAPPHHSPPRLSTCPPPHHSPPGLSTCPPPHYSPPNLSTCPPPHHSPPNLSTYLPPHHSPSCISPYPPPQSPPTSLSLLPDSPNFSSQPPNSQTPNSRRRPPKTAKNDFLASDESTRSVLKEINKNLKEKNDLKQIQMRRNFTERLRKYRQKTIKSLTNYL